MMTNKHVSRVEEYRSVLVDYQRRHLKDVESGRLPLGAVLFAPYRGGKTALMHCVHAIVEAQRLPTRPPKRMVVSITPASIAAISA